MLTGKRPFIAIALLLVLALSIHVVPMALAYLRGPVPPFKTSDLRNPRYVAPYTIPTDTRTRVTVYGPSTTETFWETPRNSERKAQEFSPSSIVVADASESATLPDGETMRIVGFELLPTRLSTESPISLPPEEVYYDANGRPMTASAAAAFHNRLGRNEPIVVTGEGESCYAKKLTVIIETGMRVDEFREIRLCDETTGWPARGRNDTWPESSSGDQTLFLYSLFVVPVSPSRLAFHMDVWQGEAIIETYRVEEVAFSYMDFLPPKQLVLNAGQPNAVVRGSLAQDSLPDADRSDMELSGLPARPARVEVTLKDGTDRESPIQNISATSGGWSITFGGTWRNVAEIKLTTRPGHAHVVIRLPDLPIAPIENRGVSDIRGMVFPKMELDGGYSEHLFLNEFLQASVGSRIGRISGGRSYPLALTGTNVGDYLEDALSPYPNNELILTTEADSHAGSYFQAQPIGRMRQLFAPGRARLVSIVERAGRPLLIVAGLLALWKLWLLLGAIMLRRTLAPRGYKHFTFWDFEYLRAKTGRSARRIPRAEELGTIPGVDAGSVRSIVKFMRGMKSGK